MSAKDKAEYVQERWKALGGVCPLCKRKVSLTSGGRQQWAMDHDHRTGLTREALCSRCNSVLGWFEGDTEARREAYSLIEVKALALRKFRWKVDADVLRRMTSYVEFWRLRAAAFERVREQFGRGIKGTGTERGKELMREGWEAAWVLECARAGIQYKRWIRRKYSLRAYRIACWIDDKPHTHTLAKRARALLAAGADSPVWA